MEPTAPEPETPSDTPEKRIWLSGQWWSVSVAVFVWLVAGLAALADPSLTAVEKLRAFYVMAAVKGLLFALGFYAVVAVPLCALAARSRTKNNVTELPAAPNPPMMLLTGVACGLIVGVGVATVSRPAARPVAAKPTASPVRAAAVPRPEPPTMSPFLEHALRDLPASSTCTNDAVKRKAIYVARLVASQQTRKNEWGITPAQVGKIWDGYGLCSAADSQYAAHVSHLTDESKGHLTTTMYFGSVLAVPTYYGAGDYRRARYYLDLLFAVRADLARRPAWASWIKQHDQEIRPLGHVDALLNAKGITSAEPDLYPASMKE